MSETARPQSGADDDWDTIDEAVREHPSRFAVKPGHILSDLERSVEAAKGRYVVVEKVELAAEAAGRS